MECYQLDVKKISAIKVNNGENLQNSSSNGLERDKSGGEREEDEEKK